MNQILVVDDSPTIRRMVKTSLQRLAGAPTFVEAGSGLEAIERLALGTVDLMVLDLNMPDIPDALSAQAEALLAPASTPEPR